MYASQGQRIYGYEQEHPVLRAGLILKLDRGSTGKTWVDSSGYGNHGALINTPLWSLGVAGAHDALAFVRGTNDAIEIAHTILLVPTIVSICAWVYPLVIDSTYQNILIKESPGATGYQLFLQATTGNLAWYSDASGVVGSGVSIPVNVWSHCAIVGNGSNGAFYVNGVSVATGNMAVSTASTGVLSLGAWSAHVSNAFGGRLGDVRLYNRALSAAEVVLLATPAPPIIIPYRQIIGRRASATGTLASRRLLIGVGL